MLKGERIFISGGNGVIGKELVEKLHAQGATLLVGDLKPRPTWWSADIRYRQGDLNYITAEELLAFQPTYFFHLAATFERSTESYGFWEENHQHNVALGYHLMNILKDCPTLKKVINCSSYLIYDPRLYSFDRAAESAHRLRETDPIYPRNLTGMAKLQHEIELRFLNEFRREQFQSVSARIYRSYGKNSRDIISRWIRALLQGETLHVYRKEGLFDYIYAGEVAEGLIRLAAHPSTEGIYNLGNDNARRVSEVIDVLRQHFPNLKTEEHDSDIAFEASQANMDYTESVLGWKPRLQLEDAIPMMIEHERRYGYQDEEVESERNVLVTSISKKIPMLQALQQAARKLGRGLRVIGGDVDDRCLGAHFADGFWKMPRLSELSTEQVVAYCQSQGITAIIPSRDGELLYWAEHAETLAKSGISVMISPKSSVEICLDKWLFYNNDLLRDFPIIPTYDSLDQAQADRWVVKERYGAGSRSIGLNLSREAAAAHAQTLESPIFQPFIQGEEISVDAYLDRSAKVRGLVLRRRELVVQGESQITTTFREPALEALCTNLLERLQLRGHIVLQVFKTHDGYAIIECNTRFGGASTLSIAAGLDSFYWFLLEANGVDIQAYPFLRSERECRLVRYPKDSVHWI